MSARAQLEIAAGFATRAGQRSNDQDFCAIDLGTPSQKAVQGSIAAIADGSGTPQGGRIASELAVRTFIDDYRSLRELNGVGAAAIKCLDAYNLWLNGQSHADPALHGAATTFTAAVLLGRMVTILHVGDSRAWRWRAGNLTLLTDDHTGVQAQAGPTLLHAIGLELALRLDIKTQRLEKQDRFLLTTRGVHASLSADALARWLARRDAPQAIAEAIVNAAIEAGGDDDATALVIDVLSVPAPDYNVIVTALEAMPIGPMPNVGDTVDGFNLVRVLAESKLARLFLATDDGEWVVLKFPNPATVSDIERTRFMREVFIGEHITQPNVGASLFLAEGRQSRLYVAMPYYKGETLEDRLRRGPMKVKEATAVAIKAARGLSALHRAGVTHRDIKPQNIMLLDDGEVKLIDFGIARLPRIDDADEVATPGTLDYMAPELFRENRGDALSDQYALGLTIYRMLAGVYPLGETPPGERPHFGPIPPLSAYRNDVPDWLNDAVMRTLSLYRDDRFADLDELIYVLEHGNLQTAPRHRAPLIERNPLLFWQLLCALLAVLLLLSLARR
ncbi:bifunctional protein-serine/threonine kinase/phosphatase [uncultured Methylovirgula sp.]|uniref:bifunctional protein-serine/threonine kinase/phosphatase n=1 Tax=uncultured Methylovirgula sp. TaxID=1285960 RepID=UPI0026084B86|nr:bifunctional protein-serine/threonine kinase/phosphatase [uncultured Methylovirgula sp.]